MRPVAGRCWRHRHCFNCGESVESGQLKDAETEHGCCGVDLCLGNDAIVKRIIEINAGEMARRDPKYKKLVDAGESPFPSFRFHAYQLLARSPSVSAVGPKWVDGRMLLPTCLLDHVRRWYPEPNQQYRGAQPRLAPAPPAQRRPPVPAAAHGPGVIEREDDEIVRDVEGGGDAAGPERRGEKRVRSPPPRLDL